ncbi:hypothetical protein ACFPRL_16040 [Pseudoclavibacter helvolus]
MRSLSQYFQPTKRSMMTPSVMSTSPDTPTTLSLRFGLEREDCDERCPRPADDPRWRAWFS